MTTNGTEAGATNTDPTGLNILVTISTYLLLTLVMFGMSCTVTVGALRETLKHHRKAFSIALVCQVVLMPALAYIVSRALNMNDLHSLCLILLGCCPGGSFSNVLAYFAGGNLALSISLTCVTNLCCIFTLPLLLFIWGSSFSSVIIPYGDIVISFSLVLIPSIFGVYLRYKSEKHAKIGERIGAGGGALMVFAAIISGFTANGDVLADREILPVTTIVSVCLVSPMGMLLSFVIVKFLPLPGEKISLQNTMTIALETGIQNTVLALAIVNISFHDLPAFELFQAQFFPICWGLFVLMEGAAVILLYRLYLRYQSKRGVMSVEGAEIADIQPGGVDPAPATKDCN